MYYLMNKDNIIATFEIVTEVAIEHAFIKEVFDKLPFGCNESNFSDWVNNRQATKHREHLTKYLRDLNADSMSGFIKLTHSVSINDTYWVKSFEEDIAWSQVSLYCNDFDEVIQNLAFDGNGVHSLTISTTSPEFGTNGMFEKCWRRESDGIFLYKRGSEGLLSSGREPYSEVLASKIFTAMNAGIGYELVHYRSKVASKCKLFTSEDVGFVPYNLIPNSSSYILDILRFFDSVDSGDAFRRMLVCDAIVFNTDRHFGNFGCLYNTNTQELLRMAPCFDYNMALFPRVLDNKFNNIDEVINASQPYLGTDFVATAKAILTPEIKADLKNLKGFTFELECDDKFTSDRVDWLTSISNQQIDNILSNKSFSTYTSPNNKITPVISAPTEALDWCKRNAPEALKSLADEELWDCMKTAYYKLHEDII